MDTNDLQQSLLQTIDLLSTKIANSTNAPLTIKAEIVEELDSGLHQYSIKYGGTIYKDAYSMANMTYEPSTVVYILIPDGNFDNSKLILNAVEPTTYIYADETETVLNIPISDNIISDADKIALDLDLQSWESKEYDHIDITESNNILSNYFSTYRNFLFSAKIKTEIDKDHQVNGNYGLKLRLPFKQANTSETSQVDEIYKEFIMDVTTMQGNPYAFNEYQTVNLYYELDDTLTFDPTRLSEIVPFTKDFGYITNPTIDSDIHIRDVNIKVIDVLSEENQSGYYLSVVSDSGNYFLSGRYTTNKTLSPLLKVNGKTTKTTGYECYWFVKDASINTTSDNYYALAGPGWKCLNKKVNVNYDDNGKETYQYVTNNYSFIVEPEDVPSTAIYRCILAKGDTIISGEIKLKNLNSDLSTSLVSYTGSDTYVENVGNVTLVAKITNTNSSSIIVDEKYNYLTKWQRYDKDGNYLDDDFYEFQTINELSEDQNSYITTITFPCSKIEKINTINCTFYRSYKKDGDEGTIVNENIATETIVISTSAEIPFTVTIDGGDKLYKYDSDGDSPMVADYDGPRTSIITATDPLTFRVFKEDGSELTETEYKYCNYKWSFPRNSMMKLVGDISGLSYDTDYYYIEGRGKNQLNYTILPTYNKKKNNNTILLAITLNKDTINTSSSNKFIKDGEGGTNGTKYSCYITYKGYAYGERDSAKRINKFQAIYCQRNNTWYTYNVIDGLKVFDNPIFDINVYKDGERISNNNYEVTWNMFDSYTTDCCFGIANGKLSRISSVNWTDINSIYCNIIEACVTIKDGSITNASESIYAYYPIEITRVVEVSSLETVIPNLDGGYEEVIYASDGTNPQYDNTNPFSCVDALYGNSVDLKYSWSCSNNLSKKQDSETSEITINPNSKYDNGITKNYVKAVLGITEHQRNIINNQINEKEREKTNYENQRNTNNQIIIYTRNLINNVKYDNYKNYLNNCITLLQYRYNLLNINKSLKDNELEKIKNYCRQAGISFDYNRYKSILEREFKKVYCLATKDEYTINNLSELNLYLLGSNSTPYINKEENFDSKTNAYIDNQKYKNKYNSYAEIWDNLIQKYNKVLNNLKSYNKRENEFEFLKNLDQILFELSVKDYTIGLNINNQIKGITNKIINISSDIISYNAFDGILREIDNIINIYKVGYYEKDNIIYSNYINIYINKNTELTNKKEKIEDEIAELKSFIIDQQNQIIHIKPIVMHFDRYELSGINGWDGSKLYVDSNNDQYLYAPQIGAGIKEEGNTFTGMLMGLRKFNRSTQQDVGLFGYSKGIQSIFLNAKDGSATFGISNEGQIQIIPGTKAIIQSGNYSTINKKGMMIDFKTPEIKFGSGNFEVNSAGHITAKGGGTIAGWNISDNELYSSSLHLVSNLDGGKIYSGSHSTIGNTTNPGFYLSKNGLSIIGEYEESGRTIKSRFMLKTDGNPILYSNSHDGLDSTRDGFYLSNNGLSIGSKVYINKEGKLRLGRGATTDGQRCWTIDGTGTIDSYIGFNANSFDCDTSTWTNPDSSNWNIGGNFSSVYLGTNGIRLGNKFAVSKTGDLCAKNIYLKGTIIADKGKIGDWEINGGEIVGEDSGGQIRMNAKGSIYAKTGNTTTWSIDRKGNAKFNNITCNNVWSFGAGNNKWTNDGTTNSFTFGNGSLGGNTVETNAFGFTKGTVGLGNPGAGSGGGRGITYNNNQCIISGEIIAKKLTIEGDADCSGIKLYTDSTHYLYFGTDGNKHPTVSGLNVSDGGISMDGSHGISNCPAISAKAGSDLSLTANKQLLLTGASTAAGQNDGVKVTGGLYVDGINAGGNKGTTNSVAIVTGNNKTITLYFSYGVCYNITVSENS